MKKSLLGENCPQTHRGWGNVLICIGLVAACIIDFCHCDMSLWSVSNRKGRLTIGQQFRHCCDSSFYWLPS